MKVQEAESTDYEDLLELFPRLAAFDLPQNRNPDHLWSGDAEILKDWAAGNRDDCLVHVAKNEAGKVLGVAMVTMRPELLSHAPSAHLEALVVAENAEGQGVGSALLASVEEDDVTDRVCAKPESPQSLRTRWLRRRTPALHQAIF